MGAGIWMTTVYPLACSYIHFIKNQCHSFYTSHLHVYYFTAQKPRGKSLSGVGGRSALWGGGGGGTLLTAMKSDFYFQKHAIYNQTMQLLILSVLVLLQSLASKQNQENNLGAGANFFLNKLGITFRETEKSMDQGCHWCKDRRVFSWAVGVERVREAEASGLDYTDW